MMGARSRRGAPRYVQYLVPGRIHPRTDFLPSWAQAVKARHGNRIVHRGSTGGGYKNSSGGSAMGTTTGANPMGGFFSYQRN